MRRALIFITPLLVPAVALAVDPDNKPPEQQQAELRQEAENEAQQLKPIKANTIDDVLTFSIKGNDLALKSALPTTEGFAHLKVPGLGGYAKVQINAGGTSSFQLIHQDYPSDGIVLTMIFAMPNHLQISRDEERGDYRRNIQLIQSEQFVSDGEGKIKLYINIARKQTGEVTQDLKISAANIHELRRKHPVEMAKYIEPIFRELHQEYVLGQVDPKLAWQVFAPLFTPDEKTEATVKTLAKQLDAETFPEREKASKALAELGAPAALVLMRQNRSQMSEEQQTRVDALVAPYKPLSDDEATKLRTDKFFLLDCLYSDELEIRSWALGELKKQSGANMEFDLKAPRQARNEAVSKLRTGILNPATRPAAATPMPK
ncbi:MAG TPA: hypothetical protein VF669_22060 [Tepidisphaeraceae bacterium]|jgi:hypothetical protein